MSVFDAIVEARDAHYAGESVLRVDLNRSGNAEFETSSAAGRAWHRWNDGDAAPLQPADDRYVPAARSPWLDSSDLIAYRPGRRIVLAHDAGGVRTIIKGYRRGRSADLAARLRSLEALNLSGFRLARLIRSDDEIDGLFFERLEGKRLEIRRSSADLFYQIGRNLRELQDVAFLPELPRFDALDELHVLDRWAERVHHLRGEFPARWPDGRQRVESALRSLIGQNFVVCHRDLHDRQLIDLGDEVGLIDFDLVCRADATLDAANLLAHLNLRALQEVESATEAGAQACGDALLDGLDRIGEIGFWPRLRVFEATSLLRLALVYSLRPRWAAIAPVLVELAVRCLDDLETLA